MQADTVNHTNKNNIGIVGSGRGTGLKSVISCLLLVSLAIPAGGAFARQEAEAVAAGEDALPAALVDQADSAAPAPSESVDEERQEGQSPKEEETLVALNSISPENLSAEPGVIDPPLESHSRVALLEDLYQKTLELEASRTTIDATTVIEPSRTTGVEVSESRIRPTEPAQAITAADDSGILPAIGIASVEQAQSPVSGSQPETGGDFSVAVEDKLAETSILEENAGLSPAVILALFALISLILVARRDDSHRQA